MLFFIYYIDTVHIFKQIIYVFKFNSGSACWIFFCGTVLRCSCIRIIQRTRVEEMHMGQFGIYACSSGQTNNKHESVHVMFGRT
jgi:hypothetical protein